MSQNDSQDPAGPEPANDSEETHRLQRGGSGAASALERMKAEHAMRHKRHHGPRHAGPGHEDDSTPAR